MDHHIFISHASEDKDHFVRPLAAKLHSAGVRVWYDEYSLQVGDSLRESIDTGLASCAFGLVILSPNFFKKRWAKRELNGLVAREMSEDRNIILPLWLNIEHKEIATHSPPLADLLGIKYHGDLDEVVAKILDRLRYLDPYRVLGGEQNVTLDSPDGSTALWTIRRKVQINRQSLSRMETRISSAGDLDINSFTPGARCGFKNVSGTKFIEVVYEPPISPGQVFCQEVILKTRGMYQELQNAASISPALPCEEFLLSVETHYPGSIGNVWAYKLIGREIIEISGVTEQQAGQLYSISIKNLLPGVYYSLIWERTNYDGEIEQVKDYLDRP